MDAPELPPPSETVKGTVSAPEPVENIVSVPNMVSPPGPVESIVLEPGPVKNIVLVGRTGNGKSATGNSIIGKQVFVSESQATGVTMTCQTYQTETPDGLLINMIDTPGLFDLSVSAGYISKEIVNCMKLATGGIHVVVLVISLRTRITQEEQNTLSTLQSLFGIEIMEYLIVLFTGGDELEANNKTLDDYLSRGCPEFLKTVLNLCDGRKVLFNNRSTDEGKKVEQVQQFLAMVKKIGERNGGKPFTDEMHQKIKENAERLSEQQREVEAKNLGERELAKMKQKLQQSYEQQMRQMTEMVKFVFIKSRQMIHELRKNIMLQTENNSHRNQRLCNIL